MSAEGIDGKFAAVAARAGLGFWEYQLEGDRFEGSPAVMQILGLPTESDVELRTVSRLYLSESEETFERAIELVLANGKAFSFVSELETVSGLRKWVRTQGEIAEAKGNASRRVIGTIQDISDIHLMDRVAQESQMTLNQVEQITHIGHWSVSLADGSIYHSDEIKRIFGYEPSEYALSVEQAIHAYHPGDRDEVVRLFNRAVETGEGYEFDLRVVQPGDKIRHVHSKGYTEKDASGKVVRVYGIFQDITDQVLAEQALRESEESMKALVDGVRTAIVVHGKDGEILLSNQMANQLLAPLTTDIVGSDLSDPAWNFVSEDGQMIAPQDFPVGRILRTGEPVENLVMGRRTSDAVAWFLVNGVPVLDRAGELTRVIVSFVDITAHREVEARLHQAEKMKVTGQLAGGVAHDFNNQLMVMMSFAELLKGTLAVGSVQHAWVDGILSGVSRSAQLTKQLLAFARKGKYVVTTVDLNQLITEVASMATHSFDKKIRISHNAGSGPATVAGDASQLQNALLNMALNSRDAMPEGGEIVFTTERTYLDQEALMREGLDLKVGEVVKLTIRDSGSGMEPATLQHMFEPFFTTKGPGKGTGMGMASVYGTVKNHHGAIGVESQPDAGTLITIYLPFAEAGMSPVAERRGGGEKSGGRILIVDDDEGITTSLSTLLDQKGYEAVACSNGRDAIRVFEESWKETDLVLLDMIMPEMNGVDVFHALKKIDPHVKVVLISGFSFSQETKKLRQEGAIGFVEKPVASHDLLALIADAIRLDSGALL